MENRALTMPITSPSMLTIAAAYYRTEPSITDPETLFDDLFGDLSKTELQSVFHAPQVFRSYIAARSRLDFSTGNIRVLDGIYFSLTELKICALAHPSQDVHRG